MSSDLSKDLADIRARIAKRTVRENVAKSIDRLRKIDRSPSTGHGIPPGFFQGFPDGSIDPHHLPRSPFRPIPEQHPRPISGQHPRPIPEQPSGSISDLSPRPIPEPSSGSVSGPSPRPISEPSSGPTPFVRDMNQEEGPEKFSVGIVGAGMAGLYTAMILKSLKIKYMILEASERIGGRVYTHRFLGGDGKPRLGEYYDVGAMRFPQIALMERTFDLFKRLDIQKDITPTPKQGTLIPYHFSGPKNPRYFNNVLATDNVDLDTQETNDIHGVSVSRGGKVPDEFVAKGVKKILEDIFKPWKDDFVEDFEGTWERLMDLDVKAISTRHYILEYLKNNSETKSIDPRALYYVTNWCETMDLGTLHYDASFTSTLLDSLEFDYPVTSTSTCSGFKSDENIWWCLNGGADVLTEKMADMIERKNIRTGKRVTAISRSDDPQPPKRPRSMKVKISAGPYGKVQENTFSHVITTTTTSSLQTMDLRGAQLNYAQREAIRVLRYDNSVKLGIKFKRKWWIAKGIIRGGLGKTDRPTRVVVYPSYALKDPEEGPGVLLACYNWSVDAARIGGLRAGNDPTDQDRILDVVIQDLAIMHDISPKELYGWIDSYHFHDWYVDEFTVGAFGMFSPGQFSTFFTYLEMPAGGGNLFFVGELTSIYHGWIVAALNSAYRGVHQMLVKEGEKKLRKKLEHEWGTIAEYDSDPEGTTDWLTFLGCLGKDYGDVI